MLNWILSLFDKRLFNGEWSVTIRFVARRYDIWIGAYWDRRENELFVMLLPCLGFALKFHRRERFRVWFVPLPAHGMRGVVMRRFLWWAQVLYRDINGKCYRLWHPYDSENFHMRGEWESTARAK